MVEISLYNTSNNLLVPLDTYHLHSALALARVLVSKKCIKHEDTLASNSIGAINGP